MAIVSPIKTITSNNKIVAIGEFTANDKISINTLEYNYIEINGNVVELGNSVYIDTSDAYATLDTPGIIRLNDDISNNSNSLGATANTVNYVYELLKSDIRSESNASNLVSGIIDNSLLRNIPNSVLSNSFITINSSRIELGNSISGILTIDDINDDINNNSINLVSSANVVNYLYNNKLDVIPGISLKNDNNRLEVSSDGIAYSNVAIHTDKLSSFAVTTSSELGNIISDVTGTDRLVFSNNAVLVSPSIDRIQLSYGEIFSNSIILDSTNIIDSFPNLYSSAQYLLQIKGGTDIGIVNLLVVHDGNIVQLLENKILNFGTLSGDIMDGMIRLQFNAIDDREINIKFIRTTIQT